MSLPACQALLTVRDLIRYGVSRFNACLNANEISFGHGTDNAWDEAVYLTLYALHLPPHTLDPFLEARVLSEERQQVLQLFERRIQERLPAPYLTHEAWLGGQRFYVDRRVIVPRSPISELLVEDGLLPWVDDDHVITHVLDLCTGSGCLAVLLALAFPFARVDGVDISEDALAVAQQNIAAYALQDRVFLHCHDLFNQLAPCHYDLIICNPPYVNNTSMAALPPEYQYEPALALAGGDDGMNVVRRVLKEAPNFMAPNGILVLEIGHECQHFEAAFPELNPVWVETSASQDQVLILTRQQLLGVSG